MNKTFIGLFFCIVVVLAFDYKNLQGPPSEFGVFTLPPPKNLADVSAGAVLPITLNGQKQTEMLLHADQGDLFSFCVFSPISETPVIFAKPPGATIFAPIATVLAQYQGETTTQNLILGEKDGYPALCYKFNKSPVGTWTVNFKYFGGESVPVEQLVGYVVVHNYSPIKVRAYLAEDLLVGQNVGIYAELFMTELLGADQSKVFTSLEAQANILTPKGQAEKVPLTTQNTQLKLTPQDEVAFEGILSATEAGPYYVRLEIKGVDDQGAIFQRTVEKLIQVDESSLSIASKPTTVSFADWPMIEFQIPIQGQGNFSQVVTYAELWSVDVLGIQIPIAWMSGLSNTSNGFISLKLHMNWISSGKFQLPFVLKNVRLQEPNYFNVLASADDLEVDFSAELHSALLAASVEATEEEMRNGLRPKRYQLKAASELKSDANVKLILVHGYCSDGRPFSEEDFTDFIVFTDPDANRKISEFSKLVLEWIDAQNLDGFSLVAHSQGGLVSLNIATYYWSGLDMVEGGRKIQSVGSPYQGTALSGFISSLAGVFGYGCGSNEDLSKDGAQKWLANIPSEKRALVYFTTSEGSEGCSSAADWAGLETPNDGVVSHEFAQLPGGNAVGNLVGYCHVEGLNDPPQCRNHENNKILNSNAARTLVTL